MMVEMVELISQDSGSTARTETTEENHTSIVSEEISDREMPLSFVAERHLETIEGINCITQTWRMKERVRVFYLNKIIVLFICVCVF